MSSHSASSDRTVVDTVPLAQKAKEVADLFNLPEGYLQKAVDEYIAQSVEGLASDSSRTMPMIPSYVSHSPTGNERGVLIALDLGGTNFRVCAITLEGQSKFKLVQEKCNVPNVYTTGSLKDFISFLADCIEKFLVKEHPEHVEQAKTGSGDKLRAGFTFSFPLNQTSANNGTLIRWTKGYDIPEAVGKDIPQILQKELDDRNLNLYIAAVVNDTVGTLLARAYTKPQNTGPTIVGAIFGTGTNGAYAEPLAEVTKFNRSMHPNIVDDDMVINTEWGSFDNDLKILPNTKYDALLNSNTHNKDYHMFEKRVSGMFLGELLRLVLVDLYEQGYLFTTKDAKAHLTKDSKLYTPWSLDTSTPAIFHADTSSDLVSSRVEFEEKFGFVPTFEELEAIKLISVAIGTRSAHLSAVPIAGALIQTKALEKYETVDIGIDGTVYELYPNFHDMIVDALEQTSLGKEGTKKITMGIAKDGSGVGAALCALDTKVSCD